MVNWSILAFGRWPSPPKKKLIEYNKFFFVGRTLVVVPSIPFPREKFPNLCDNQAFRKWVGRVAEFHLVAILAVIRDFAASSCSLVWHFFNLIPYFHA